MSEMIVGVVLPALALFFSGSVDVLFSIWNVGIAFVAGVAIPHALKRGLVRLQGFMSDRGAGPSCRTFPPGSRTPRPRPAG